MRNLGFIIVIGILFSGCAIVSVVDAAVSVTATAVKTTASVAGAVVDVAIPDGDEKKEDSSKE